MYKTSLIRHTGWLLAVSALLPLACAKEAVMEDDRIVVPDAEENTVVKGERVPVLYSYDFILPEYGDGDAADDEAAKTVFGPDKDRIKWEAGDRLGSYVKKGDSYSYNQPSPVNTDVSPKTVTLKSTVSIASETQIYAYYPYVAENVSSLTATVKIPAAQRQVGDEFNTDAMPMVSVPLTADGSWGKETNRTLQMVNLGSVLCFNLYDADNRSLQVTSIELISGDDDVKLAGDFSYDLTSTELDSSGATKELTTGDLTPTAGSVSVATHLSTAATIPAAKASGKKIYMVVAPCTVPGLTVKVYCSTSGENASKCYAKTISSELTFTRSAKRTINLNLKDAVETSYTSGIPNAAALIAARDAINGGTSYAQYMRGGKLYVCGTINMYGKSWTSSIRSLDVDFDGGSSRNENFKITNLSASVPLFDQISSDVTLDHLNIESGTYTIDDTHDAAYIARANYGTISSCTVSAGMSCTVAKMNNTGVPRSIAAIAAVNGGTISDCTNAGAINLEMTTSEDVDATGNFVYNAGAYTYDGVQYVGGIAGLLKEGAVLSGNTNNGAISFTSSGRLQSLAVMGGIAGGTIARVQDDWGDSQAIISGCTNTGAVTFNFGSFSTTSSPTVYGAPYVGGVVGFVEGGLTNCTNSAMVEVQSAMAEWNDTGSGSFLKGAALGGIAGVATLNVINCDNSGTVYQKGSLGAGAAFTSSGSCCIGGICGYACKSPVYMLQNCDNTAVGCNTLEEVSDRNIGLVARTNMKGGQNTTVYIAGIVGRGSGSLVSCTNSSAIKVYSRFATTRVGGLAGSMEGGTGDVTVSGSSNSGDIDIHLNPDSSVPVGNQSLNGAFAGLVGQVGGSVAQFSGCSNSGDITVSGGQAHDTAYGAAVSGLAVAGLVAWGSNKTSINASSTVPMVNSGDILLQDISTSYVFAGGCVGHRSLLTQNYLRNEGTITFSGTNTVNKNCYVGGVLAFADGQGTISHVENASTGAISVNELSGVDTTFVGGIAGRLQTITPHGSPAAYTFNTVSTGVSAAAVSVNGSAAPAYVSGGVGLMTGPMTSVSNSGAITLTNAAEACVGGVVGCARTYKLGSVSQDGVEYGTPTVTNPTVTELSNTGSLRVNTSGAARVGGVMGFMDGLVNVSEASCNITASPSIAVTTSSGETGFAFVGGVLGDAQCQATYYSSGSLPETPNSYFSSGSDAQLVTLNNTSSLISVTAAKDARIGGVIGYLPFGRVNGGSNTCPIEATGAAKMDVGGVLGYSYHTQPKDNYSRLDACSNDGYVQVVNSSTENTQVGGIAGGSVGSRTESHNSADIRVRAKSPYIYVGGVDGINSSTCRDSYNTGNISIVYEGTVNDPHIYAALGIGCDRGGHKYFSGHYDGKLTISNSKGDNNVKCGALIGYANYTGDSGDTYYISPGQYTGGNRHLYLWNSISIRGTAISATNYNTSAFLVGEMDSHFVFGANPDIKDYDKAPDFVHFVSAGKFTANDGTETFGSNPALDIQ